MGIVRALPVGVADRRRMAGDGARLGFGCTIGAMVGGIASGSLHGWLWLATAFVGSILAIPLRPRLFGMGN